MKYCILKWVPELLRYEIIFHSHDYHDMERRMKDWPESCGYVHMIEINALRYHDFQEMCKRIKEEKAKA